MELEFQLIFGVDKMMHFLSYAVISVFLGTVLILISVKEYLKQNISFIWFVIVTIGIVEEYRQYLIPNRSAELLDAIANMFGVTFGLAIPLLISYVIQNRKQFVFKLFVIYSIVLIPLFLGLAYFNERPIVTFSKPFKEKVSSLIAMVGF